MRVFILLVLVAYVCSQSVVAPTPAPTPAASTTATAAYHCVKISNVWKVEHGAAGSRRRAQAVVSYPMCPHKYTKTQVCAGTYPGAVTATAASRRRLQAMQPNCEMNTFVCRTNPTPTTRCADPLA